MYTDKRLEKAPLTVPTPIMPPTPLNEHASHHHTAHALHMQHHHHHHLAHHLHPHHHHHPHHMQPLQHTHHQQQHLQHDLQQQHIQQQQIQQQQQQQQQQLSTNHHNHHAQQLQHQLPAQHPHPHSQHQQQQVALLHVANQNQQQQQQQQQPTQVQQQTQQQLQVQQQHPSPQQQQQQSPSSLFTRFDANKSTKGASKLRRDLINAEIANLRDLLPLPQSTRQRLSQLQLMALVCVYVRKANYFQQVFKRHDIAIHHAQTPNIGFSKALSGFLMMLTQNGKLLYISDNAAEYLGHSMEDLLIHGDSVYDIIDKQDHTAIQAELNRNVPPQPGSAGSSSGSSAAAAAAAAVASLEGEHRMFLCRMNVSRNARRQMRFGDQKVVLVQGHYLSFLPLCSRNEPVFLATCTPIAMPETRECVVQGATNVFTTIHAMDMKIVHIDKNGEFHLDYTKNEIQGLSWYNLLHTENLREAQSKHRLITQSEQDRSCILLVRMQRRQGDFIWVHVVLQVRDSQDTNQQPVIVCTNQVLNEREASVMIANSWLYHYYSVQSKIQFGLAFDGASPRVPPTTPTSASAAAAAAAAVYYHHHHHHHHQLQPHHAHTQASATTSPLPAVGYPPHQHHSTTHANHHHHHHHSHLQQPHHQHAHHYQHHMTTAAYGDVAGATQHYSNGHGTGNNNGTSNSSATIISSGGNGLNGHATQYVYQQRLCTDVLDYSQINNSTTGASSGATSPSGPTTLNGLHQSDIRCNSANSSVSSHTATTATSNYQNKNQQRLSPPPLKKQRVMGKLEPLYLPDSSPPNLSPTHHQQTNIDNPYATHIPPVGCGSEMHASVVFATVVPTRPRFLNKSLATEPPDFIDQWNPSPPWSENAQKISLDSSSSSLRELSPCITTTPPTPTSAPPTNNGLATLGSNGNGSGGVGSGGGGGNTQTIGPAFSFEWMSDPLVPPTADANCACCLTGDGSTSHASHHQHHLLHLQQSQQQQPQQQQQQQQQQQHQSLLTHHTHAHWTATANMATLNPRQHLSQHLASHGHQRLLSLSALSDAEATRNGEKADRKIEVSLEEHKKKKESPRR